MNKPGVLLYKCRRCGKVSDGAHTPNGLTTLMHILWDIPLPKQWGNGIPISKEDICICDDGSYGASDCIGFSVDSERMSR